MSLTTPALRVALLEGDGHFGMKVAGTSHHQGELENLAGGRTSENAHHKCAALLLPEPDNPYDPNAVAVYIVANGSKTGVGYLQSNTAPFFNRTLLRDAFSAGVCNAMIVGGWHSDGGGEDGFFGARLDACLPFQLQALALPDAHHDVPVVSHPVQIAAQPVPVPAKQSHPLAIVFGLVLIIAAVCGAYFGYQIWP